MATGGVGRMLHFMCRVRCTIYDKSANLKIERPIAFLINFD